MKILRLVIVEDSEDDTLLILRELKKGGYMVSFVRVETAAAMNEALRDGPWDLIISDHALPGFSAPEALNELNQSGFDLPFIIVSSIIGEEVAVAAMKAGAHDYIMKNNLARLVPVIERALYDAGVRFERRKAKEALRESEARFRRLAENAPDLIYRYRLLPDRCFEYVSPSAEAITGYSPEEHYGRPNLSYEIIHSEDRHLLRDLEKGELPAAEPLIMRWIHKSGRVIWIEQRIVPVFDDKGRFVAIEGIARDVTDRILKEQQLKTSHDQIEALSNRILTVMEAERSRLARELHDELGQALTAVKLDLQMLNSVFPTSSEDEDRLRQSIDLVDHTINLVRRQSGSLRPPALDDLGLLPAIRDMARGFMKRTGIETVISENGIARRLFRPVETALYRCVQESLTNVARHAQAKKVLIDLKRENGFFLLQVADDGIGFEPEKLSISSDHIGLTGMQERVKLLAGELKIDSAPGRGTVITIRVPWSEDNRWEDRIN